MNVSGFYRAFEDRYRGSRELISQRLEAYLPFVAPLKNSDALPAALDLGCGRGEWLELLQREGFKVQGIDLDEGMLAACTERGLHAIKGDAIAYLSAQSDESLSIISGFHIAEHIAFEDLQTIVIEALRALKPGGLLILETPNPENLVVGTNNFYLDPTHLRPIPALLLSFVPEYYGFERVQIVRLQEDSALHEQKSIHLIDVLRGVSADYGIVAQKWAEPQVLRQFDPAFKRSYGIGLGELAKKYDKTKEASLNELAGRMTQLEEQSQLLLEQIGNRVSQLEEKNQALELVELLQAQLSEARSSTASLEQQINRLETQVQQTAQKQRETHSREVQLAKRLNAAQLRVEAMGQSLSWRLTAPLRWGGRVLHPQGARDMARSAIHLVLAKPNLAESLNKVLLKAPRLHSKLRSIAVTDTDTQVISIANFDEFVAQRLLLNVKTSSPYIGVEREHIHIYGRVTAAITQASQMQLNPLLLQAIREGSLRVINADWDPSEQANLAMLVRHIFLALLKRYPNQLDEEVLVKQLLDGVAVTSMIMNVKASNEYKQKNISPSL